MARRGVRYFWVFKKRCHLNQSHRGNMRWLSHSPPAHAMLDDRPFFLPLATYSLRTKRAPSTISVFAQNGAAGACPWQRGHFFVLALRSAHRCAMPWLPDIFAQAGLLRNVADYLFWSPSPRHCMACGFRDLQTGPVFCRFLLCCRGLSSCSVNDAAFDIAVEYMDSPEQFMPPDCRWRAVRRLRFLTHVRQSDAEEELMDMQDRVTEKVLEQCHAWDVDWSGILPSVRRAEYEECVAQFLDPEDLCGWHTAREDIRRKILAMHVEWIMEHEFTDQGR